MATEEKNIISKEIFKKTSAIIETTYEKVLSIINKVKEFIKKNSSDENNLIEELEWVIKVITNKSLYSYDLKKAKLVRKNTEYNKFISFVTKYNEEVIEMNKRHDIVSSIFSLGKKGQILLKPSLCLKKELPDNAKNMNEVIQKEKIIKQKNFINVFGNLIVSLYNKEMERRKRKNSCEISLNSETILRNKDNYIDEKEEIKYNNKSHDDNDIHINDKNKDNKNNTIDNDINKDNKNNTIDNDKNKDNKNNIIDNDINKDNKNNIIDNDKNKDNKNNIINNDNNKDNKHNIIDNDINKDNNKEKDNKVNYDYSKEDNDNNNNDKVNSFNNKDYNKDSKDNNDNNDKKKKLKKQKINNEKNNNNHDYFKSRQKTDEILETDNNISKKFSTFENDNNTFIDEKKVKKSFSKSKINKDKKENNIHRIKLLTEREKKIISNNSKLKLQKSQNKNEKNMNNFSQKKSYTIATKLTKQEKITFNNIKKSMQNYYLQFMYNGQNSQIFAIRNNFIINNKNLDKNNYNNNIIFNNNYLYKKNKENIDLMLYKAYKYGALPYNIVNKSKIKDKFSKKNVQYNSMFKNQKNFKNLKNNLNLDYNEDKLEYIKTESLKNKKKNFSKKLQIKAEDKNSSFLKEKNHNIYNTTSKETINENPINNISIIEEKKNNKENTNSNIIHENKKEKKIDIKKEHHERNEIVRNLMDKYFEDIKQITNKDFNIFDFKNKVSYKNVLPIMCKVILKTLGLIDSRIISLKKLDSFLYSVSDNYKETTLYHNSLHGSDVTQSLCIYFLNSNVEEICETTVLDLLGLIVSAMGHDLGHPGLTNNFHINAGTELAITYNDASCLENFHSSFLFKILRKEENNIIEKFSSQDFKTIRKRMISQILATDMANHGEVISLIRSKINIWKEEETQSPFSLLSGNEKSKFDEQQLLLNYLIHMADLGHNCKKFEISLQWVELLSEEFWAQGDKEREKGLPISFLCDRNKIDIPGSQVGFLKGFIISSFDCLVAIFPKLKYTMDNAQNNIAEWMKLQQQKRKLGWTPKKEKEKEDEDKNKNENESKHEKN